MINLSRKNIVHKLSLGILIGFSLYSASSTALDETGFPEAKIKVAYLVNFLRFVEWPEDSATGAHICIIGYKQEYHDALKSLASQSINNGPVIIREYTEKDELQNLTKCQIIFITSNASHRQKIVANTIKGKNILTVGENEGFAQQGGMINFINRDDTIRFEINLDAVRKTELIVTAKILRIADRVLHTENDQ